MENTTAKTIQQQIGRAAFAMIGARNLVAGKDFLSFRIGRNSKGVNFIKITLDPFDTYSIEFGSIRGTNYKVKADHEGVYADMIHDLIEKETGLYTSLGI